MVKQLAAFGLAFAILITLVMLLVLIWQGWRKPNKSGQYVALGSSFAAGLGLGAREPGSPLVCMRSTLGYPHQLAALTRLKLVDMTCAGSRTEHILYGGQVFLGPQLVAVNEATRLVTITSGGNDVGYIGDLTLASGRAGLLGKLFWKGPKPLGDRGFATVTDNFCRIVSEIRLRAPKALVVLVSYPAVLPEQGSCAGLGFGEDMAATGRDVGQHLREATRLAAELTGAVFVDMVFASRGHDACSPDPWVNAAAPEVGAPFHPNHAGAKATAATIYKAIEGKLALE